ncbi:MAG: hypothetical protein ACXW6V_16510, partial [Candidatus Binatia bacterium]
MLTERDDVAIFRHGVSLLSRGSGRLDTRLDTPPLIIRRHPDFRAAPEGENQMLHMDFTSQDYLRDPATGLHEAES